MVPVERDEMESRRIGRYVLYGELAAGGMATVHLGRLMGQAGFSKTVAIKRLHQHLATEAEFVTMLIDEAKLASFIHHPNVVSSLDVIKEGDELLLVMDYVEGETLARLLGYSRKDGRPLRAPSVPVVVRVLTDVLAGLHAAHTAKTRRGRELQIVHRDVSPQNIMIGVDGIARVLDFGIAKAAHRRNNTRPGRVKGKFAYMSPEQVRGMPVDARTDVFAAGVVLWECLAKRRLFAGQDPNEVPQVLTTAVSPPSRHNSEVSAALDRVVLKALSRDRDARFESAAEFADALSKAAEQSSSVEVGRWVAGAAKKTLDQRRGLLDHAEETTVDGVLRAMEARAEDNTHVIGPVGGAKAISRPHSQPGVMSLPPVRHATTPWARIVLIAAGVALLAGGAIATLSDGTTTIASAPLPTTAPAKVAAPPEPADEGEPPPIVLASDLPRLPPQEAASAAPGPLPAEPARSARAPATSAPSAARAQRKPDAAKTGEGRAAAAPEPKAAASAESTHVAAPSCDPPYRIDAAGIRRVRRECL
jgi:eukaryotic-like serine/threonine-protein kinase